MQRSRIPNEQRARSDGYLLQSLIPRVGREHMIRILLQVGRSLHSLAPFRQRSRRSRTHTKTSRRSAPVVETFCQRNQALIHARRARLQLLTVAPRVNVPMRLQRHAPGRPLVLLKHRPAHDAKVVLVAQQAPLAAKHLAPNLVAIGVSAHVESTLARCRLGEKLAARRPVAVFPGAPIVPVNARTGSPKFLKRGSDFLRIQHVVNDHEAILGQEGLPLDDTAAFKTFDLLFGKNMRINAIRSRKETSSCAHKHSIVSQRSRLRRMLPKVVHSEEKTPFFSFFSFLPKRWTP